MQAQHTWDAANLNPSSVFAGRGADVIVLTASLPIYQPRFERALRLGGRMFVVTGATAPQEASLVRRVGETQWSREGLFETALETLEHAPRPPAFSF